MGQYNDVYEVIRLQSFLKYFEGADYVTVNGVFDQATEQAVSAFQLKYQSEVLTPWGISEPTGYAYIRTIGKINQIICNTDIPGVTPYTPGEVLGKEAGGSKEGMGTSSLDSVVLIGNNVSEVGIKDKIDGDGTLSRLATAMFSWPDTAVETLQCLYELLLILIVLYILGNVLESVLYKDNRENVLKRFYTKWATMVVGLILAFFGAYILKEWCLLLPLLIAIIAEVLWVLFAPRNRVLRDSFNTWYTSSIRNKLPMVGSVVTKQVMVTKTEDGAKTETVTKTEEVTKAEAK